MNGNPEFKMAVFRTENLCIEPQGHETFDEVVYSDYLRLYPAHVR